MDNDTLVHYGTPQNFDMDPNGSGRYRQGSGDNPNQHFSGDRFDVTLKELKSKGLGEKEIAKVMGYKSTGELRAAISINTEKRKTIFYDQYKSLKEKHPEMNKTQLANELGVPESTLRARLKAMEENKKELSMALADNLQKIADESVAVDVGKGVEHQLGCSNEKKKAALQILEQKGYKVDNFRFKQQTNPNQIIEYRVLHRPDVSYDYIYKHRDMIRTVQEKGSFSDDGDTMNPPFRYPESMEKKRLAVRFSDGSVVNADGTVYSGPSKDEKKSGLAKDGLIEVRKGCKDLYFGTGVNYCQARILVDGSHYIKGMAVYSDNLPDGVDVLFNTNKDSSVPILGPKNNTVLKPIKKDDPTNPFGSAIKEEGGQSYYLDPNGKYKNAAGESTSLSLINKRASEGDWDDWSKNLPSQFLSKQNVPLIRRQINLTLLNKEREYKEINELTNPEIKKKLLEEFADGCDTESVNLKAAALPGQRYQVILPLTSISDKECYAPNFKNGSKVALIRYPHGGIFEIPILTVNNNNQEGKSVLESQSPASDVIGITKNTADRLSGADFDGDFVMVIPLSDKFKIDATKDTLPGLKGFDPKFEYGCDPKLTYTDKNGVTHYFHNGVEFKPMTKKYTQKQMGIVSNLITDMTLQKATDQELERAVKHSMVVIDAEKHHLDYKESERINGVAQLKRKYQHQQKGFDKDGNPKYGEGASTLISKAKSTIEVPERKEGLFVMKDSGKAVVDDEGKGTKSRSFLNPETGNRVSRSEVKELFVDPKTGKKLYRETGKELIKVTFTDSDGNKKTVEGFERPNGDIVYKKDKSDKDYITVTNEQVKKTLATQKVTRMSETDDAFELSRGTVQEKLYAEYANRLKNMANQARLQMLMTEDSKYSKAARMQYLKEVDSLKQKIKEAEWNAPFERQAQLMAGYRVESLVAENPSLYEDKDRYKKLKNQILADSRNKVGAYRRTIDISEKEWEAIQAGAVTSSMIKTILKYADEDKFKSLAMPRKHDVVTKSMADRMSVLSRKGYTNEEISEALGVSVSTVIDYTKGGKK